MEERSLTIYIQDLDISDKSKYALLRMKIFTLNDLEKRDLIEISGSPKIGKDTIRELQKLQEHIEEIFYRFEVREERICEIFDSVKEFSIEEIPLSNRALNALKRAEILKVGDMIHKSQKDIMELRNVGIMTRTEITSAIDAIISEGSEYFSHPHLTEDDGTTIDDALSEERAKRIAEIEAEVGDAILADLSLSTRAHNALRAANVITVGELLHLTEKELSGFMNVGKQTKNEILMVIENIMTQGSSYFCGESNKNPENNPEIEIRTGKGFDFPIIERLSKEFFFKPSRMTEWFSLSRQGIYNAIEKRSAKHREIWTGKQLSEDEYSILRTLIKDRKFDYTDEQIICCCMNNRQDD